MTTSVQTKLAAVLSLLALLTACACRSATAEEPPGLVYSYFNADTSDAVVSDSTSTTPAAASDASIDPCDESCGEPCMGKRYWMDRHYRAGCAQRVGWWAVAGTNCRNYEAGYVGGGAVIGGDGPDPYQDGTWGLDYVGIVIPKRVFLGWWHGRKHQGGTGAYQTDGPKREHH